MGGVIKVFSNTMNRVNPRISGILKGHDKFLYLSYVNLTFWYLAMFPGRVGFDTKLAFELMRNGEGTEWWTGWYWRILQVFTFNGSLIFFFSFCAYSLFWLVLFRLINVYSSNIYISTRMKFIITFIPVLPVFAMTVQHDVLFCTGVLGLVANEIKLQQDSVSNKYDFKTLLFILPLLLTTKQGVMLIPLLIIRVVWLIGIKKSLLITVISLLLVLVPSMGLSNTWTRQSPAIPMLMDIKCAVQHPESRVSEENWRYLESLLPRDLWKKSESCKEIDGNDWQKQINFKNLSMMDTLRVYLELLPDHAEIYLMAHIQRSTTVLPPPFFRGPDNQVNLDYSKPIGENTNLALQSGSPLLHPSVDDPSVDIRVDLLRPLSYLGQGGVFLINQASRYWAWGGLWFWALILHTLTVGRKDYKLAFLRTYWYLISLHFLFFLIGISSTGRHVMPTICIGLITLSQSLLTFALRRKV